MIAPAPSTGKGHLGKLGSLLCRYGPFWIATTLVFLSAVAGNYASYVSYRRTHAREPIGSDIPAWYYDIDKARLCWRPWLLQSLLYAQYAQNPRPKPVSQHWGMPNPS